MKSSDNLENHLKWIIVFLSIVTIFATLSIAVYLPQYTDSIPKKKTALKHLRNQNEARQKIEDEKQYVDGKPLPLEASAVVIKETQTVKYLNNFSSSKQYTDQRDKTKKIVSDDSFFKDVYQPDKDSDGESIIRNQELTSSLKSNDVYFDRDKPDTLYALTSANDNSNLSRELDDLGHKDVALYTVQSDGNTLTSVKPVGSIVKAANSQ